MNREEYFKFHEAMTKKMTEITRAKNADYCGAGDDPFKNFRLVEKFEVCSTEQGFFTRIMDKLSRIASYIQKGELQVKDESVTDTLIDACNYLILFAGYLQEKKNENLSDQK